MKTIAEWLTAWGTVGVLLLTAASLLVATIAYAVHVGDEATASRATDVDHELRLRVIEKHVTHIDTALPTLQDDVTWICDQLGGRAPHKGVAQTAAAN